VFGPLVRVTARGLLGRRRILLVALLALAPVAAGGLTVQANAAPTINPSLTSAPGNSPKKA
jgi:hypothetical protein